MELLQLLKDSPMGIAMLAMVWISYKIINRVAQRFAETMDKMDERATARAKECHEVHLRSITAMEQATAELRQMQGKIDDLGCAERKGRVRT